MADQGDLATEDSKQVDSVPIQVFTAFVDTVTEISNQTDASEVALTIIEKACYVLNCERTSFFFVDGDHLDLVIGRGLQSMRLPITSGIAGACATSGEVQNIPDPYVDPRFSQEWDKKNNFRTKSILAAPVVDGEGMTLGVLQGINKNGDVPFTEVDEQLIKCLAGQVGVSIRYTYHLDEAERATKQRNALVACIKDISAETNVQHLLFTMNKAVIDLVEAEKCSFWSINRAAESLSLIKSDAASDITIPMSSGLAGHAASTGETVNIPDAHDDPRFNKGYDLQTGFRTREVLVLPVFAEYDNQRFDDENEQKSAPIAVLQVINKEHGGQFTRDDEEVLDTLVRFVGPAIANSPLFGNKSNTKRNKREAEQMHDINPKLTRKPSREFLAHSSTTPRIVEGGEGEGGSDDEHTFPFEATDGKADQ